MRNYIALAFLAVTTAAPAAAQRPQPVYHGAGYDIVLPARCRLTKTQTRPADGYETELYGFESDNAVVVVERVNMNRLGIADTTLATRRAMLQLARVGMVGRLGRITIQGEPADFERGDRFGLRLAVSVPPKDRTENTVYGTVELSIARQGDPHMWVVMYLDRRRGAANASAGERLLESFSLTHAAPTEAEAASTVEGSKDASAEDKGGKADF
jgi:hypothetical protein